MLLGDYGMCLLQSKHASHVLRDQFAQLMPKCWNRQKRNLQEERNAQELLDDEDKPDYTPQAFDSLRQVPMYSLFIKERFERCLDLYLCPRSKKKRINVDPQSLIPKLPKPQDLQPFPSTLLLRYTGHTARVSGPITTAVAAGFTCPYSSMSCLQRHHSTIGL